MSHWVVADSLYDDDAFWCGHLDSLSWYLREAGEVVTAVEMIRGAGMKVWRRETGSGGRPGVLLALDDYARAAGFWGDTDTKIAQVAAICPVMPWDVRKPDGSPAYDLVLSSIPWMVDAARVSGCRAEYMPLAFDTRALVCSMGVKERDITCLFVGTRGSNHRKREEVLNALGDLVTIAPPTFGRAMFSLLARAKVVLNVHAEWARGVANAMRIYEAAGMQASIVSDGDFPLGVVPFGWGKGEMSADEFRSDVEAALRQPDGARDDQAIVLQQHTYVQRIPQLIDLARSL